VREKIVAWKAIFIFMTICAGLAWSFAGTLLMPAIPIYQVFVACILSGVASGAVPYFSGSRLACAAFVIPTLVPFSIWLLLQNIKPYDLLGYITLFFIVLLMISSFRTHSAVYHAIRLKFENTKLLQNLFNAKKEMEVINQELRSEIHERTLVEKLLRDSEEQYSLVTNALPVLISYIDLELHYRFNNKAYEEWFGKPLAQITGKPIKEILDPSAFSIFNDYFKELHLKGQITYESIMHFKNNDERYVSVTLIAHRTGNAMQGFFSLISDITPRINYLATHDSLTDLPNRGLLNSRFTHALRRAQQKKTKVALIFVDIDHFKNVNDTFGHDAGDQLLIRVVNTIKNSLHDLDTLARIGGDEFAILIEDISADELLSLSEMLHKNFRDPFRINGQDIFTSVSMGISLYPDDGQDIQILFKNADLALYRAKERGRNTFEFYTAELNEKITKKLTIGNCLHDALENKEFEVYYQPITHIKNCKIIGLEALIRWRSKKLGAVPPSEFIPVAEETGLIVPIGEWVLNAACTQNYLWQKNFYLPADSRISINLSARQFRNKNLVEIIAAVLEKTGLQGKFLTLELTESLIMQDMEYSSIVINTLKEMNIAISIDDFGTGYSSLSYLRRFPIDIIKIDRSFIMDVATNSEDAAIVRAIIIMAHSLKMKVVAEGVETIAQYNFLKNVECDEVQGYIISYPRPAAKIEALLQNPYWVEQQLEYARLQSTTELIV
jgi:diguanylate cyclase (GGDEF)-like protein/PAS domain S-box-containing protein